MSSLSYSSRSLVRPFLSSSFLRSSSLSHSIQRIPSPLLARSFSQSSSSPSSSDPSQRSPPSFSLFSLVSSIFSPQVASPSLLRNSPPTPPLSSFDSLASSLISQFLQFSAPSGFKNFRRVQRKDSSSPSSPSDQPPKSSPNANSNPDSTNNNSEPKQSEPKTPIDDGDLKKTFRNFFDNASGSGGGSGNGNSGANPNQKKPNTNIDPKNPWYYVGVLAVTLFGIYAMTRAMSREITFQDFRVNFLEKNAVERLEVNNHMLTVYVVLKPQFNPTGERIYFNIGSVESFERVLEESQRELGLHPHEFLPVKYISDSGLGYLLGTLLQIGVFLGVMIWLNRQSGMGGIGRGGSGGGGGLKNIFQIGKSPATMIKPGENTSKITFADVAGLDDAKVEVMEFVKFLKNPEQFTRLGAKIPKGALLCGPPGTGKTLLAKAIAGEASVPFFSISGSDFIEMFVGVGPSRVRDLFAQARANTPCIIWIDEIDAVGRSRSKGGFSGGNDERENTLNQLLVEMDGFNSSEGVVVLAGTNRRDILDKALLRPGRFDRQITIGKPDIKGRAQIFEVHLKKLKLNMPIPDLASRLSALTPGFAGADIANLCNEAALIAARTDKAAVELIDFEKAADRIIGGLEKSHSIMNTLEKKLVAYHEAGHAVVGWFLEHADPLLKVTIVPRSSGALGFAQYLPKELSLYHQQQLFDMMCMALGGRAAEQVFFGRVSTGASDDLQRVTKIAQSQVAAYGMSEKLGNVSYQPQPDDSSFVKPYSENTAQQIDEEVRDLVQKAYVRTIELVQKHRTQIEALANKLIESETINHDQIVAVLGPRPFSTDEYSRWMNFHKEEQDKKSKAKENAETQSKDSGSSGEGDIPQPAVVAIEQPEKL